MKRYRILFCLLAALLMLFFAVPRFHVQAGGLEGWFSIIWIAFALFVIAGNLVALLYMPKERRTVKVRLGNKGNKSQRKRVRLYE